MFGDISYPLRPVVIDQETCFFLPADYVANNQDPVASLHEFMTLDIFSHNNGQYLPQSESFLEIVAFAKTYLQQDEDKLKKLFFHNVCHTFHPVKGVLSVALKLAIIDGISPTDQCYERIGLAAALHDIGNIIQRQEHEQISIDVSYKKLVELGYSQSVIDSVACSIYSTAIDYKDNIAKRQVGSREAKILSDADLSNPGFYDVNNFATESIKIWLELDLFAMSEFETTGVEFTRQFFTSLGGYYTRAAAFLFSDKRRTNLRLLGPEIKTLMKKADYSQEKLVELVLSTDQRIASLTTG
ncbi:HD domain-containing protein [Planctobacterium marinum]|uniref:HD domain-containing protein n=1 Tax=Planctobacterium marinum TaxID=1631968 RepID=UPI001E3458B1|nr:HD domain-containing protein [Planctobacterium marinum]MCC2604076.1 HD domain-containing protein [Planctobacterium marinum]